MATTTSSTSSGKTENGPKEPAQMTYGESFSQWWNSPSAEQAEHKILEFLPFFPESDGIREAKINQVEIDTHKKLFLNEFQIVNTQQPIASEDTGYSKDLVVLHGYGAGLALFFQNFKAWSSIRGSRTFALDLLGFGRSSRPKFKILTKDLTAKDEQGRFKAVIETEDWFIDSIEKWRQKRKLDKFTLMGHSMGGYLAAAYAFRYPEHVERLIMVSPAGVERGYTPDLERKSLFASSNKIMENSDVLDDDKPVKHSNSQIQDDLTDPHSTTSRNMSNWVMYLWNQHISPFKVLKASGFLAPRLISRWTTRRFSNLPQEQHDAMRSYIYRIFTAGSSGEYAITRLLAPGALARMPLVDRVATGLKCPSLWIYGDQDWMNERAGHEAVKRLSASNKYAEHHLVESAGHHVYLDNPDKFDGVLLKFLNKHR